MTQNGDHRKDDAPDAALDPKIEALIGAKLRAYYDDLLAEPVPDRIVELLQKLDAKERGQEAGR